ncbi:hypothetical protein GCM10011289_34310 [Paludibacterium paludis]|uniref:LysE type translocator n=1 Tax=Paludibacterium paludis TaxID=1225769 RepID=A0A918UBA7_9NEIS|nr:hypothetical protein GCM10011289_34310 [Paludibacterium paludis]
MLLTLANPMTILSFLAVFAAFAGQAPVEPAGIAAMVSGIVAGSLAWWAVLSLGVAGIVARGGERFRQAIARLCAVLLSVMGVCLLYSAAGLPFWR